MQKVGAEPPDTYDDIVVGSGAGGGTSRRGWPRLDSTW